MADRQANRLPEILLVEDELGDALLTEMALRKGPVEFTLQMVSTGEEALSYLEHENTPDIILLDLNLPGMHGLEVLEEIKSHEDWRRIPVVVLTSSEAEVDRYRSYNIHCNAYMVKPGDPEIFEKTGVLLNEHWLSAVRLPPR